MASIMFFSLLGILFLFKIYETTLYYTKSGRRTLIQVRQEEIALLGGSVSYLFLSVHIIFYIGGIAYCLKEIFA